MRKDADHSARWLAAVHFKNSVSKYWRSRAPGAIAEDEKIHLRAQLILLLDQEDSQIAVQTAVVLAKVGRLDFPKAWPSLFTDLLGRLQAASEAGSNGTLSARRCYLALHHILKELSTKRLAADQRTFEGITSQLLEPLWSRWVIDTGVLVTELPKALAGGTTQQAQQAVLLVFERWLLQLKAVRRMLLFGFPSDSRSMTPVGAIEHAAPTMLRTLETLLKLIPQGSSAPRTQAAAMLTRGCLKLIKTLRQLSETHPWSVLRCGVLVQSLDLCCNQIASPSVRTGQGSASSLRQCLQFLHSVLRCAAYRGSPAALSLSAGKGREQMQQLKDMATEAAPMLKSFWVSKQDPLVNLIITRIFPLTEEELELWDDNAEEFHQEVDNGVWEESVRGCGERVFVALLEQDRTTLAPLVVSMLQRAAEGALPPPEGTLNYRALSTGMPWAIRVKAAVYHAVAAGAYELYDTIDFSQWLQSALLHEASDASPVARPLRREAIKLVAAWASKMKRDDRPPVYRALIAALADHDAAIHLSSVTALHALVDDWEFDQTQFIEFVPTCFQLLAALLQEVGEFEAQVEIFALINLIIDRLGEGAAAYAAGLLSLLPSVWESAEGQSLLRIQVMLALQRLVHALGPECPIAYPVLFPVLHVATDPSQPDELNLMEDGLLLWLVALRHAPTPNSGLLAPLPHLLSAMETSTEHIAVGSRILTSCLLMDGREILTAHGSRIASVLAGFIGNVKERGMLCLLPVIDLIVQIFPADGPSLLAIPLQRLVADVMRGTEPGMVVAASMNIFARVLLHNPGAFLQLFQGAAASVVLPPEAAPEAADPAQRLLLATLDLWLDKFDSISAPPSRKLSALALCALLAAPVPGVLQRCSGIAACVTAAWFELEGPDAGPEKMGAEYLSSWSAPRFDELPLAVNIADAEGEEVRRLALFSSSPVATLRLSSFCAQQLDAAANVHGGGALNEALNAMDPLLGAQLKQMLGQ